MIHLPQDTLYQEYILNGLSLRDIAVKYGWSKSNVRRKIIDYNIGIRTQKDACSMPNHILKVMNRKAHLGIRHSDANKEHIKLGIIKAKLDTIKWQESRNKVSESLKQYYKNREVINKISNRQKNIWANYSNDDKQKIINNRIDWWNAERRNSHSLLLTNYYKNNPLAKEQLAKRLKDRWDNMNDEQRWHCIQKAMLGACRRPNKPETIILNILNELYPKQWRYTGNGSFIIGGLNPDFVNINGQKKVIEMFGDYWHRIDDSEYRTKTFSGFGYSCLIIWEHELGNIKEVTDKIISYENKQ
jgi:hypothetical protein